MEEEVENEGRRGWSGRSKSRRMGQRGRGEMARGGRKVSWYRRGIEGTRAKGIGDGDGKLWIVERRPLDSELSGTTGGGIARDRDRDTIGFSLRILRISETELNTRGTPRYRGDNERTRETAIDQPA